MHFKCLNYDTFNRLNDNGLYVVLSSSLKFKYVNLSFCFKQKASSTFFFVVIENGKTAENTG